MHCGSVNWSSMRRAVTSGPTSGARKLPTRPMKTRSATPLELPGLPVPRPALLRRLHPARRRATVRPAPSRQVRRQAAWASARGPATTCATACPSPTCRKARQCARSTKRRAVRHTTSARPKRARIGKRRKHGPPDASLQSLPRPACRSRQPRRRPPWQRRCRAPRPPALRVDDDRGSRAAGDANQASGSTRTSASDRLSPDPRAR